MRPEARRGEVAAWSKALSTVLRYARSSIRRASTGSSGAATESRVHHQRCTVRVMYTANKISGQWRAHGRYIARESASGDQHTAGFGTSGEDIAPGETLARWQSAGDPRLWKLIISPEFGERIDLDRLTRDIMADIERDLGTKLEWVAVAHFNTEHPHVHVALRGVREDGSPLDLPRDYIRSGIRPHAERACTLQLGYRTSLDAAAAQRRETTAQRFT
jgi:type IV secretory pathway VirD2 relaxase